MGNPAAVLQLRVSAESLGFRAKPLGRFFRVPCGLCPETLVRFYGAYVACASCTPGDCVASSDSPRGRANITVGTTRGAGLRDEVVCPVAALAAMFALPCKVPCAADVIHTDHARMLGDAPCRLGSQVCIDPRRHVVIHCQPHGRRCGALHVQEAAQVARHIPADFLVDADSRRQC